MKELHREGLAIHPGPESCASDRKVRGEALTGGGVGPVLSRERHESLQGAETVENERRPHPSLRYRE